MSLIEAFRALPEDENDLRARTARASKAKALLGDPLFTAALQACRDRIVGNFTACKPSDTENMREQRLLYAALDMIVGAIGEHIEDGKIADGALREIERRKLFARKK